MEHQGPAPARTPRSARNAKGAAPATATQPREILFPQGLIGCPSWQRFQLLPEPFETCGELTSLDEPGISLLVADPAWLGVTYQFELDEDDGEALRLERAEDARLFCILSLHRDPAAIVANLAGPLIINWPEGIGRQVVLDHQAYPLRAPVIAGEAARAVIDALAAVGEADPSHAALAPTKGA
jgi:flagellar assembly factor FliW